MKSFPNIVVSLALLSKIGGGAADSFNDVGLARHNELRGKHGAPAMTISEDVCSTTRAWAANLGSTDQFAHNPNTPYGENIYASWGLGCDDSAAKTAVDSWYDEIKDYDFNNPGFAMNTGHFTQVVWKDSVRLCMAKATSASGACYVVANYDPPGNYGGQFPANVLQG